MNPTQSAAAVAPAFDPSRAGSPHQMISRLLEGALRRLARARIEVPAGGSESLTAAVAIVRALQDSLDLDRGGQLAHNLHDLYDYMLRRLRDAADEGDPSPLNEVGSLLDTIREGWDAIAPDV